jgi:hypothetical protein
VRNKLIRTPDEFGKLRYPRLWYTRGPGRKDVDDIVAQLEKALTSGRARPTPDELKAAEVHAGVSAADHFAARAAMRRLRNHTLCEHEAADVLRLLIRNVSPEWVAHQLANLLPPEDREAAQMAQRVVKLAVLMTRTFTRDRGPGIDFF